MIVIKMERPLKKLTGADGKEQLAKKNDVKSELFYIMEAKQPTGGECYSKGTSAPRVPYTLRKQLKNKLNELEKAKLIIKKSGSTEWVVNSLVIVPKANNDLRFCIDPNDINNVIKRTLLYTFII